MIYCKEMKKVLAGLLSFALLITGVFIADRSEAAKKIFLNKTKATVYVGKTVALKVKGTKKKVTWKSKNKKIATVSKKGVVKGKKEGKVWIQAKVAKKTLKCRVTVKSKKKSNTTSNNGDTTQGQSNGDKQTTPNPNGDISRTTPTPDGGSSLTPSPVPTPGKSSPTPSPTPTQAPTPTPTQVPTPTPAVPGAPVFSKDSGEYSEAFNLTLSGEEGSTIYYTTDGSVPLSKEENAVADSNRVTIPSTTANEEFYDTNTDNFKSEDVSDGVKLTYGKQYVSVCFKSPDGVTDWSSYTGLEIQYTVHNIGNGTNTLGLQICPIYTEAESSWNGTSTSSDTTRVWEARTGVNGSGTLSYDFTDSNRKKLSGVSVGRLMLGVYNSGT